MRTISVSNFKRKRAKRLDISGDKYMIVKVLTRSSLPASQVSGLGENILWAAIYLRGLQISTNGCMRRRAATYVEAVRATC